MNRDELTQELIQKIINDGLIGPWSWSDQLQHVCTIVTYGVLRKKKGREMDEELLNSILEYIKKSVTDQLKNV